MNPRRIKSAPDWLVIAVKHALEYASQNKHKVYRLEDHCRLVADCIFTNMGVRHHDWEEAVGALEAALEFVTAAAQGHTSGEVAQTIKTALLKAKSELE